MRGLNATARRLRRRLPIFVLLAALLAPGFSAEATVLPTQRCRDYFFLKMDVGGDPDRQLSLLLDTGASHTLIDPDALERVSGKRVDVGTWARFDELVAGDVTFRKVRARSRELDHLIRAFGPELDGILGFPVFAKLLLTFDYARGEVRVEQGRLLRPDGKQHFRLIHEKKRPFIDFELAGRSYPVLLDTGSAAGLAVTWPRRVDWAVEPRPVRGAVRINRIEVRKAGRLAGDLPFGPLTLESPILESTDGTDLAGGKILKHLTLTFDQRRRVVRMVPNTSEPVRMDPFRASGIVWNPRPEGLVVERVYPDTAAEAAGIQVGDVVTRLNGVPIYERSQCDPDWKGEAEGPRRLTLQRDGVARPIEVEIEATVLVP